MPKQPLVVRVFSVLLRCLRFPFQFLFARCLFVFLLMARWIFRLFPVESARLAHEYSVLGSYGARLQTVTVVPAQPASPATRVWDHAIKHILYFCPMGVDMSIQIRNAELGLKASVLRWSMLEELQDRYFRNVSIPVTFFNYHGVGQSTEGERPWYKQYAPSFDDLVEDGLYQVFSLLHQYPGLRLNQIELYGHSLGGGVATLVAQQLRAYCQNPASIPNKFLKRRGGHGDVHKTIGSIFAPGQEPYLFNDRSFRSLSSVMMGWCMGDLAQRPSAQTRLLHTLRFLLVSPLIVLISLLFVLTGCDCDAGAAFKRYPRAKRNYAVVRGDDMITSWGSLHQALAPDSEKATEYRGHFFRYYWPQGDGHKSLHSYGAHIAPASDLYNAQGQTLLDYHAAWLKQPRVG